MAAARKALAQISQTELEAVETWRERLAWLRAQVKEVEGSLAQAEHYLIDRLEHGARVRGGLTAIVERVLGPSRPHYKEELVAHFQQAHDIAAELVELECRKRWPGQWEKVLVIGPKPGPKAVR